MNRTLYTLFFIGTLALLLMQPARAFSQDGYLQASCEQECSFLTKDCTAYVECRVAKGTCLENCMQRKVWEKVATSLDHLSNVLEAQEKERKAAEQGSTTLISTPPVPQQQAPAASSQNQTTMGAPTKGEQSSW